MCSTPSHSEESTANAFDQALGLKTKSPGPNTFAQKAIREHRQRLQGNAFYQQRYLEKKGLPPDTIHPAFRLPGLISDISKPLPQLETLDEPGEDSLQGWRHEKLPESQPQPQSQQQPEPEPLPLPLSEPSTRTSTPAQKTFQSGTSSAPNMVLKTDMTKIGKDAASPLDLQTTPLHTPKPTHRAELEKRSEQRAQLVKPRGDKVTDAYNHTDERCSAQQQTPKPHDVEKISHVRTPSKGVQFAEETTVYENTVVYESPESVFETEGIFDKPPSVPHHREDSVTNPNAKRSFFSRIFGRRANQTTTTDSMDQTPRRGNTPVPPKAEQLLGTKKPKIGRSSSKTKGFFSRGKTEATASVPPRRESRRASFSWGHRRGSSGRARAVSQPAFLSVDVQDDNNASALARSQSLKHFESQLPPTPPAKDTPPDEKRKWYKGKQPAVEKSPSTRLKIKHPDPNELKDDGFNRVRLSGFRERERPSEITTQRVHSMQAPSYQNQTEEHPFSQVPSHPDPAEYTPSVYSSDEQDAEFEGARPEHANYGGQNNSQQLDVVQSAKSHMTSPTSVESKESTMTSGRIPIGFGIPPLVQDPELEDIKRIRALKPTDIGIHNRGRPREDSPVIAEGSRTTNVVSKFSDSSADSLHASAQPSPLRPHRHDQNESLAGRAQSETDINDGRETTVRIGTRDVNTTSTVLKFVGQLRKAWYDDDELDNDGNEEAPATKHVPSPFNNMPNLRSTADTSDTKGKGRAIDVQDNVDPYKSSDSQAVSTNVLSNNETEKGRGKKPVRNEVRGQAAESKKSSAGQNVENETRKKDNGRPIHDETRQSQGSFKSSENDPVHSAHQGSSHNGPGSTAPIITRPRKTSSSGHPGMVAEKPFKRRGNSSVPSSAADTGTQISNSSGPGNAPSASTVGPSTVAHASVVGDTAASEVSQLRDIVAQQQQLMALMQTQLTHLQHAQSQQVSLSQMQSMMEQVQMRSHAGTSLPPPHPAHPPPLPPPPRPPHPSQQHYNPHRRRGHEREDGFF